MRFQSVYYGLYKLDGRRLEDCESLFGFARDLYQHEGVGETVDQGAIRRHAYGQSTPMNPRAVVPRGAGPDFTLPHERDVLFDPSRRRAMGVEDLGSTSGGAWVRKRSGHRAWVTADGASGFKAEPGRYHLYVSNNCPWCHRVSLTRALKGLQDVVSMDVLFYRRDPERGWQFRPDEPGCTPDTVNGLRFITELYERVGSKETSVPVIWDRETQTIVNNESSEVMRMLNRAFDAWATREIDLVPSALEIEIDALNAWIYRDINNGAYKAGFTRSQASYEKSYAAFFAALRRLDQRLATRRFLCGEQLTEADVRLFPTIFRFDPVYFTRFALNERMVRDHVHLQRWHDDMLAYPGVAEASNLAHCKGGYFGRTGNNIIPLGSR